MVYVTNKELLAQLGRPDKGQAWLADVDSPDAVVISQCFIGTLSDQNGKVPIPEELVNG